MQPVEVGPLGRLGGWTANHVRAVSIAWLLVAVALAAFAPKVETALSGAGWQANGSESVKARALIQRNFAGLSSSAMSRVTYLHGAELLAWLNAQPPRLDEARTRRLDAALRALAVNDLRRS